VLAACTGVSYSQWKKDKSAHKPATAVGLGVSAAVTVGMLTTCGAVKHNDKVALAGAVLSAGFTGELLARARLAAATRADMKRRSAPLSTTLCVLSCAVLTLFAPAHCSLLRVDAVQGQAQEGLTAMIMMVVGALCCGPANKPVLQLTRRAEEGACRTGCVSVYF
jgi:hypothetical protein